MNDEFEVKIKDLTKSSFALVDVKCDYCGKHYTKKWYRYANENLKTEIHKDCCNECKKYKIQETAQLKYGVNTVFKLQSVKDKISNTNIKRYGVENPFASNEIKAKIVETNIKKYGVPSPLQNKEILQKISDTCLKKYGVKHYILTQHFFGENSPVWKGGVARQRSERFTYDYRKWRDSIFAKNLYTCQCCGLKSGNGKTIKLNAHHIKNWKDNPNDRYDVDNGITLCESCHNKFHSEFGKKNNTKEQLQSFLNKYGKKIC